MKFDRFAASMIKTAGDTWTAPFGNFHGQLSGTTLSVSLDTPARPGMVLNRDLDGLQYLVLAADLQQTHLNLPVVPVSYSADVQRFQETERDTFGRAKTPEASIVLSGVPVHQPAPFSVAVHQDPDRYDSRLSGAILLPDSYPIRESDTLTTPSGPFLVRAVQRPTQGLQQLQLLASA